MIPQRFIEHDGLRPDITYTINVIFETQWMYDNITEDDILTEKNYSLSNPLFPQAVIDVFHDRIESVLGNPNTKKLLDMGALVLKYPIYATCEQPMLSQEFKGSCRNVNSMLSSKLFIQRVFQTKMSFLASKIQTH